ncbi:E3 ubiquitin-protein ligase RNF169-like [Nomascus leucogenys]|uniref:E3 ubiquitin-protein ligase RNF169-like n=1 Tax=Nomascus leucogenys TaxID=61853 RepID=UPI00122DB0D6|nr:E3 ubiquitin-protein ligase RNF169-like [Nomascus leucogenys]
MCERGKGQLGQGPGCDSNRTSAAGGARGRKALAARLAAPSGPRPGVPRPAGENALNCSSRPGLAPPGHEGGPVRRARSREEEEGGGRPRRRAREAQDAAAAAAADAATRGPPATLTPDPRMEPALGAAAAPGAPPTSQARSLASPEAWKDSMGS